MVNRSNDSQRQAALQTVLDEFRQQYGASRRDANNLNFIIRHTPVLQDAMQQAAEDRTLRHIRYLDPTSNAAGSYRAGILRLRQSGFDFTGKTKTERENKRTALISTIAHETQHALNSSRQKQAYQTAEQEIVALAQSGQPVIDYTEPLLKLQQSYIWNEATAEIAAWNAVVDYLRHKHPHKAVTLEEVYTYYGDASNYIDQSEPDATGNRTYSMKSGFMLNTDMTLDAGIRQNIEAMRQYYFDPSFSMGACGNADYHNLYARGALAFVQQAHLEHAAPDAKIMLDMSVLRLSERLLEENGMYVSHPSGQMPYVDKQTPHIIRFFDNTFQSNDPNAVANPQAFQYIDNGNTEAYTPPVPVQQCQRPAAGVMQQTGGSPRVAAQTQTTGELSFFDKLVQAARSGDPKALLPAAQEYMQTQEAQDWLRQGQQQLQQLQEQAAQQAQEAVQQQQSAPVMRM